MLYTGKGGVGKTTTAAAAAALSAQRGCRTLVASADAAHSLGDVLEERLGPEPREVAPQLFALEIDARVESARHWGRVRDFLLRTFHHHGIEGAVAEELAMLPGVEELTTLFAVEAFAASGDYDQLILDCAPTDVALRLATLPDVARGMGRHVLRIAAALMGVAGPMAQRWLGAPVPDDGVFTETEALVYRKLAALQARITGPDTSVRLVVTPERLVIDEARRAYTELALFEVPCDAVVLNRLLPEEAAHEPLFRERWAAQSERAREIAAHFAPLPVLHGFLQPEEVTGRVALEAYAAALFEQHDPAARLCSAPRVRFEREGGDYWVRVPAPATDASRLDVARVADDLVITTPARRRALKLPRRYAGLALAAARIEDDMLHVRFARSEAGG